MRVLVCGGRDYDDYNAVKKRLDSFQCQSPIEHLIHGGSRGCDNLAARWAAKHLGNARVSCYPADWRGLGKSAGPIRNHKMLHEGRPDVVLAFPGGRGTANMVKLAKEAGVEVIEVECSN